MGTRIAQFDALLSGYVDPNTGLVGAGYTVYFYAAGTTTAKDVWTAYDKAGGAVQSVVLDATGSALVFGDGVYKLVVKNLSAATVDTFDGVKVQFSGYDVTTSTAATLAVTTDMDAVLLDCTSTNQVVTLPLASTATRPIFFKRICAGSNTITIVPTSPNTIDGGVSTSLATLNTDVTLVSDGSNWYGQAAATTNADTLAGYAIGTAVNTIPLRGTDGYITGAEPDATASVAGVVELATLAEVQTGTDAARVPTVATMRTGLTILTATTASTSGTAVTFGSIPSWATEIVMHFDGVSLNGSSHIFIQIGDSGGYETTGYVGAATAIAHGAGTFGGSSTAGFYIYIGAAGNAISGSAVIRLMEASTNTWNCMATWGTSNNVAGYYGGNKALTAALDRVQATSTDTFDAGKISISYR